MINVDVYIPSIDRTYNFNLDEEANVQFLIEEISELICKKERSAMDSPKDRLMMGSIDRQFSFAPGCSLKDYSIKNGETLILV